MRESSAAVAKIAAMNGVATDAGVLASAVVALLPSPLRMVRSGIPERLSIFHLPEKAAFASA
jgi:hypothetical protein